MHACPLPVNTNVKHDSCLTRTMINYRKLLINSRGFTQFNLNLFPALYIKICANGKTELNLAKIFLLGQNNAGGRLKQVGAVFCRLEIQTIIANSDQIKSIRVDS